MTGADLDLLVVGSGVAGLSAAVRAAETHGMRVGVVTKGELHQATTRWAQGGVAAVLGGDPDSTDAHLADTLRAGAGLCDRDAVRELVDEGPGRVHELIALGATFDTDSTGGLQFAREGGHTFARVIHAGGAATGIEVERALVDAVHRTAAAVHDHWFALDLLVSGGRCRGVRALTEQGQASEIRASNVLIATGGAGQMYSVTTNPLEVTGDGIAMAVRAGVAVADLEFVQFHPTALHHERMPRPLLSEALRGHGALIRDANGDRFVDELLPRDEVSRAITARMHEQGIDHVWLDVTTIENFEVRFPTIAATLSEVGLDPSHEWLPIAPAAHYMSGGILADLDGASSLPGLWAAGETACSGVHGANRLASNSLLDGMVFGARVVEAVERGKDAPEATGAMRAILDSGDGGFTIPGRIIEGWRGEGSVDAVAGFASLGVEKRREELQRAMTRGAGVLRSADSLGGTRRIVDGVLAASADLEHGSQEEAELANLAEVARALLVGATVREESRGAHTRDDFPERDDEHFQVRLVLT